ncbi:olfactory receptor 6B9-like [Ambystoma mexicanum]|uniref:olfactory receptor 6B9-like n=1 Tax=Ambystoma mexicanum TaxID=8296 RepID=UPI0037E871B9
MARAECSGNMTVVPEFSLLGFQVFPEVKPLLFLIFFTIYLLTVAGNVLIVVTVHLEDSLHSPMYFFLGNLSLLDVWSTSNVVPTLLGGLLMDVNIISFYRCLMQYFCFGWMASTECFLLAVMAYDRYLAICYPLHYTTLMRQQSCLLLAVSTWMVGFFVSLNADYLMSMVQFFDRTEVDHFFCDFEPLLKAACSDTSWIKTITFVISSAITSVPFLFIIVSYLYIISAILRIPSAKGRKKAFSTCSSHLTVVITYFGILIIMYVVPSAGLSLNLNKALSLLYTVATPMFNPIVYALRNKAIMDALRKYLRKKV